MDIKALAHEVQPQVVAFRRDVHQNPETGLQEFRTTQKVCEELDKLGIPYVIFLGEDEINAGVVACKELATGEQTKLDAKATIYRIKAGLDAKAGGTVIVER